MSQERAFDQAHALDWASTSGLKPWVIKGKTVLPIVQGGMGVGVSAGGLAGHVAAWGGVGTVSSVDLRRLHPDLFEATRDLPFDEAHAAASKAAINAANETALDREIQKAKALSQGRGVVAVNIMRALDAYEGYVRRSIESGADALVVGAGLPLDLPDLAKDAPDVALIPILSDARGVQLVLRKWEKKGRLPDAIVLEHPGWAGGHLGAAKVADVHDARFDFETVLPATRDVLATMGVSIPLIAAGGVNCLSDIRRLQALGASAVQMGTAFAVTQESDAAHGFKEVLAGAQPEDLVEFISVAGLPARAVRNHWLDKYVRILPKLADVAHAKPCKMGFDCLAKCGFRDGVAGLGQFCIDQQLGHALQGHADQGLFFRGAGRLPFGHQIRPVADLMQWMLTGQHPAATLGV